MDQRQAIQPIKMNLDKSPKKLEPLEAFYLLNHERALNPDGTKRGTLGVGSPMLANYQACEIDQPAGENYRVGSCRSHLTNDTFSWIYNNNNIHYVQRVSGDGVCEVVYHGCLRLSAVPKHAIERFRATVLVEKFCANRHGVTLVWTDGVNEIGALDVEASIATNSFTTPFFERCSEPCDFIKLCVPDPCGCLTGSFVPVTDADKALSNTIIDTGFKFSYRWVYYDGRASIYADPSTLFYQDAKCFDSNEGLPRCIKLRVPIGNAMVEKIEILYWKDGQWFLYDTVEKYKKYNSTQQYWYERELSEQVEGTFSDEDCAFDFLFCNDRFCQDIPNEEFNRVFNPIPREAQGLFVIGLKNQEDIALAFYNYIQGNCPLDKNEVDKFDINIDCSEDTCQAKISTVIFYALVHNRVHNRNQPIFREGGDAANSPDDDSDPAYFGGLNEVNSGDMELGHDQRFSGETRNFIGYVEGTDFFDEAKQWKADPNFTNKEEWGTLGHMSDGFEKRRWRRAIANGQYFYQKFEIKVPQGMKGFIRLASHKATGNDQDSSTFVVGIFNDITAYRGAINLNSGNTTFGTEEIYFDTCNQSEVEIKQAFVIDDNAIDAGLSQAASSYNGYIKDKNGLPVEGALVQLKDGSSVLVESKTDHNGFYHGYAYPGTNNVLGLEVLVEQGCGVPFSTLFTGSIQAELHFSEQQNVTIENEQYTTDFYANLTIKVKDCNNAGVPGVRVALSGSKYKITDAGGVAHFRPRNYSTRNRSFKAVVLNKLGCITTDCLNQCDPCMPYSNGNAVACYMGVPAITLADVQINSSSALVNSYGLKANGRYPWGFYVRGDCGRISSVYHIKYMDIPRTQEKEKLGFCSFGFNGNGINLPDWGKCLVLVRGKNINSFELQWVVDEIERTDDGKIKLTIQSLYDYNKQYLFKTNTVYQWLKGDRIEFIRNGDGSVFSIAQYGLLNYQTLSPLVDEDIAGEDEPPANFFNQLLITDDGKLDDLKKGAIIELQREKGCQVEPVYYSICASIPIVNGRLAAETGTFTTFDTYIVTRKIGDNPPIRFEHHNPSDFWGDNINRLDDTGRGYFENKYENEKRFGRNITINSPNEMNRFGDIVKTLNPATHGDIIAIGVSDNKIGLCISEHDNSLFEVGDDLLRVGQDGMVRAATSDQVISDTQAKIRGAFGCQYGSIGSVFFGDGWASWIDMNSHSLIVHDYSSAKQLDLDKAQRYFRRRCQEIETFNRGEADPLNQFRFITGMNYQTGAVMLTIKALRHSGIMNELAPFIKPNETILFEPISQDFLGFASFTAEGYERLDLFVDHPTLNAQGCAFVAYLNGIPYIHPRIHDRFNEFFGVACDWVVGVAANQFPEKVKVYLAVEIQSQKMWYVKKVTTEKTNFISEIPPIRWRGTEGKFNSEFLGNINSRAGLYGDEKARGYYAEVLFIRDNTNGFRVNTIDNNKRIEYSELGQIIFKMMVSEQSGTTANL